METIIKANVGIDLSMETFWATISTLNQNHEINHLASKEFENNQKGFKALEQWIKENSIDTKELRITMEATGVYYENLCNYLHEKKYIVHVVLPNKSKKFMQSLDIKSKTDKLDSKALGRLGVERKLRQWQPANPVYKEMKELTRERGSLIKVRTQFKNQLHALAHSFEPNKKSVKRIKKMITVLDASISEIEKEITAITKTDIDLKMKLENITSIPGIGLITASILVAETNGFFMIENSRQLCSFAGLDIKIAESGKWKGKSKISKAGNSHIRAALYLPALSTVTHSQTHKKFYERILAEKKKCKIGLTAVSRKLLCLSYSLWKNDVKYQENYQNKKVA